MTVTNFIAKSSWRQVADAARTTVNMEAGTGEPSNKWKKNMLLSEHSPIRKLVYGWKWTGLKYWTINFDFYSYFVENQNGRHLQNNKQNKWKGLYRKICSY